MKKEIEEIISNINQSIQINQPFEIAPQLSLIVKPEDSLLDDLEKFIDKARNVDPKQYYYTREQLHSTIYGDIDTNISIEELHKFLLAILADFEISFSLQGISNTATIIADPNFPLLDLRQKIALHLGQKKDLGSMCWMNILRLKKEPNKQFVDFINDNYSKWFGLFRPKKIYLYLADSKVLRGSWREMFSITLGESKKF